MYTSCNVFMKIITVFIKMKTVCTGVFMKAVTVFIKTVHRCLWESFHCIYKNENCVHRCLHESYHIYKNEGVFVKANSVCVKFQNVTG